MVSNANMHCLNINETCPQIMGIKNIKCIALNISIIIANLKLNIESEIWRCIYFQNGYNNAYGNFSKCGNNNIWVNSCAAVNLMRPH